MKNIIDFVGAFIERPRANTRQATKFAFANLSSPLRHILSLIRRAVPWCRRPQMAGFFWPSPTMEGLSRLPPGGSSRRSRVRESAWIWRNISLCPRGLLPSFASQNPPRCFAFAKLDRRLRPVLSEGGLLVSVNFINHAQYFLSRLRYCIASAMCFALITSLSSRSAIVLATRKILSYPRADIPIFS